METKPEVSNVKLCLGFSRVLDIQVMRLFCDTEKIGTRNVIRFFVRANLATTCFLLLALPLGYAQDKGANSEPVPTEGTCDWKPARDTKGRITNFWKLPTNSWVEIPDSNFAAQIKPVLDKAGYTIYKYGSDGVGGTMTNYNGMAWQESGPFGYAHGGGHAGGSDNGIYRLDRTTMKWAVEAFPSKAGKDGLSTEDEYVWGHLSDDRVKYSRSSTGFAVRAGANSFSAWAWYEAKPGPVGKLSPSEIATVHASPVFAPFGKKGSLGNIDVDIMQDGRPTPRHTYGGLHVDEARENLIMASRAFWKAKLNGTGWIKYQDGGRTPFKKVTGEELWSFLDEKTGLLWQGGCGSNCYIESYFYYGRAQTFDPVSNTVSESPPLLPDHLPVNLVNLGDGFVFVVKNGRVVYVLGESGLSISFDLDDMAKGRVLYRPPLTGGFKVSRSGTPAFGIDGTQKIWVVDYTKPELPTTEYDFAANTKGADVDDGYGYRIPTRIPTARTVPVKSCKPVPPGVNVYSRMHYWKSKGIVVYVPIADGNVWVMRPKT